MENDMTDFLYKYVLNNNPLIDENNIQSYKALNNHDLLITYNNGVEEIYDTFSNSSRRVNHIQNNNDEQIQLAFRRKLQIIMSRQWITQEELARRINSTQQMISRYLTGQSIPSAITIKKIADALEVNVNDFYDEYY